MTKKRGIGDLPARKSVIDAALALERAGFAPNKSGNISCRVDGGFVVTPAALPYASLVPKDLVTMSLNGERISGRHRPSSEWAMHAAIYRARADAIAVVHTHSPHATALSATRQGIPPIHYMIAMAGGAIRCAPYATFGTSSLANLAVAALDGRRGALLANHGVVTIGSTVARALAVAVEVENLARQYLLILASGQTPVLLEDAELAVVIEKFADYGR